MILYRRGGGTPTSFGTGGRRYSTDSRTGLQCCGRLSRPHRLTTPWPTHPSTPPYNATDDSPVRPRGRLTCPRRLTNVTADSPVHTGLPRRGRFTRERLQHHLPIINFMADYFRPGTSGDIHLKYILLVHIIEQFIFVLVCNIVDAGQLFTTSKRRG